MKASCLATVASYFALRIRLGSTTHMVKSEPKATAPRTASISFFSCLDVLSLSFLPSSAPLNLRPILTGFCFAIIAVLLTPCNILPGSIPLVHIPWPPSTDAVVVLLRSAATRNPTPLTAKLRRPGRNALESCRRRNCYVYRPSGKACPRATTRGPESRSGPSPRKMLLSAASHVWSLQFVKASTPEAARSPGPSDALAATTTFSLVSMRESQQPLISH